MMGWTETMDRKRIDNGIANMARRKPRNIRGFTLAETLLAVLILLLVSVIVATGMPAATNAYNKVILGANAKVMLSTAITALHDEIGTAWRVETVTGDNTRIRYFNAGTGAKSELSLDDGKAIQVQDYIPLNNEDELIHSGTAKIVDPHHLVPDDSSEMYVTYESIGYNNGIVTITGLKVCKKTDNKVLAQFAGENGVNTIFTIRVVSKDAI